VWLGVVIAVACGCFAKPGFTERGDAGAGDDAGSDAVDAPCERKWQPPETIAPLTGFVTGEPTITGDQTLMMWALQTAPDWKIRWADRSTSSGTFAVHAGEPFESLANSDPDPSITDDGLLVVFRRGTPSGLVQSERLDRSSAWGAVGPIPGAPNTGDVSSLDVSADGLAIYYTVNTNLFVVRRPTRTANFGAPDIMLAMGVLFPAISGDELTLYYTPGTVGVFSKHRAQKTEAFPTGTGTMVFATGKDPDVTADGTTMVIGKGGTGAGISRFVCDP
jgi:hypothetical protein